MHHRQLGKQQCDADKALTEHIVPTLNVGDFSRLAGLLLCAACQG
jgi:hypothetical protein